MWLLLYYILQKYPKVISKIINNTEFISRCNDTHNNKYDYTLTEYNGMKNKIKIICSEHGIFEQYPQNHSKGDGCKYCSGEKRQVGNSSIYVKKHIIIYLITMNLFSLLEMMI